MIRKVNIDLLEVRDQGRSLTQSYMLYTLYKSQDIARRSVTPARKAETGKRNMLILDSLLVL